MIEFSSYFLGEICMEHMKYFNFFVFKYKRELINLNLNSRVLIIVFLLRTMQLVHKCKNKIYKNHQILSDFYKFLQVKKLKRK